MINKDLYLELLNKTTKTTNCDSIESINKLISFVNENKPNSLFHYRNCNERSIEAFRENKIYFNTADNFNDPYDCLVYCNIEQIHNHINTMFNPQEIIKLQDKINNDNFIETRPPQISLHNAKEIHNCLKGENISNIISSISNDSLNIISNNIKTTTLKTLDQYINFYQHEMPLVCLTETYDNILMWSHYANNHKGFVIEYDSDSLNTKCAKCPKNMDVNTCPSWKQVMLLPILYTNERYDATEYIFDNVLVNTFKSLKSDFWKLRDDFAQFKVNIYKHECWSYEKEWRLQLYRVNKEKFIQVKPKAIYLGCRISQCYEDILVKYALEQNIKIYKMSENSNEIKYTLTRNEYRVSNAD